MKLTEDIKSLVKRDHEEFLKWFSDYELSQTDDWDLQIKADSQEGGRFQPIINLVRKDIYDENSTDIDEQVF